MKLPSELHNKIVNFLTLLPNIEDEKSRQALINRASLDDRLQRRISVAGSAEQFSQTLVPTLVRYGKLEDGRDALVAVLEAAKDYVGQDKQEDCETLIQKVRANVKSSSQELPAQEEIAGETTIPEQRKKLETTGSHIPSSTFSNEKHPRIQIFLSYVEEDRQVVEQLYRKLHEAGFRPWMSPKDVLPGQPWKETIHKAIRESDFFLACLSENSVVKRSFFDTEIQEALTMWEHERRRDIYLIPVRLDNCTVPQSLHHLQWLNFFEPDEWTRLLEAIHASQPGRPNRLSRLRRLFNVRKHLWTLLVGGIIIGMFLGIAGLIPPPRAVLKYFFPQVTPTPEPTPTPTETPVPAPTPTPTPESVIIKLRSELLTVPEKEMEQTFGLKADSETYADRNLTVWRPVKYIQNDFQDQDEVVLDRATGLIWQKKDSKNGMTYDDAQAYCKKLNLADKNDWRLPTVDELLSLMKEKRTSNNLYIDQIFNVNIPYYWSIDKRSSASAWGVDFNGGGVYWDGFDGQVGVRCVRS